MSGIFSLFSQSTTDKREAQVVEKGDPLATSSHRGVEVDIEFRPVVHPVEPISQDQPARCPLSEPSILNDGRIWKERMSFTGVKKGGTNLIKESGGRRHKSAPRSRPASQRTRGDGLLKLPEECQVDGDRITGS